MFKNPEINVGGQVYNLGMKKRKKPLGMANEARRKAGAKVMFESLMLNPHLVVVPKQYKGSRQSNKAKAIRESM